MSKELTYTKSNTDCWYMNPQHYKQNSNAHNIEAKQNFVAAYSALNNYYWNSGFLGMFLYTLCMTLIPYKQSVLDSTNNFSRAGTSELLNSDLLKEISEKNAENIRPQIEKEIDKKYNNMYLTKQVTLLSQYFGETIQTTVDEGEVSIVLSKAQIEELPYNCDEILNSINDEYKILATQEKLATVVSTDPSLHYQNISTKDKLANPGFIKEAATSSFLGTLIGGMGVGLFFSGLVTAKYAALGGVYYTVSTIESGLSFMLDDGVTRGDADFASLEEILSSKPVQTYQESGGDHLIKAIEALPKAGSSIAKACGNGLFSLLGMTTMYYTPEMLNNITITDATYNFIANSVSNKVGSLLNYNSSQGIFSKMFYGIVDSFILGESVSLKNSLGACKSVGDVLDTICYSFTSADYASKHLKDGSHGEFSSVAHQVVKYVNDHTLNQSVYFGQNIQEFASEIWTFTKHGALGITDYILSPILDSSGRDLTENIYEAENTDFFDM